MHDLREIIDAYGPALSRLCASYEADASLQQDLLQEVLLAIHRALPSLRDPARLRPFIFRIAHNRAVTHIVQQRSARLAGEGADRDESAASPEYAFIARDRVRDVRAAVRRLPLGYRQVVTLLLEDMSYAEIAETLGLSISNVGVRVNRAKARLKELLNDGR